MLINIEQLQDWIAKGIVQPNVGWGDAQETACLMSGLTGETSIEGCKAKGWPQWLAELGTLIFDNAGDEWKERSIAFANAVNSADERGVDFDEVFAEIRMRAVLPIAMESICTGDEPWRVQCRNIVQVAMDNGGKPLSEEQWKEAARAARAAGAAWAARAAAHTRIFNATIAALESAKGAS